MMPSETSGNPKRAVFEAVRSVQASASSQPPPSAKPLIIAIVGLPIFSRRANTCWPKNATDFASSARIFASSLMSAPAMKAFSPEPVITTPLTFVSSRSASNKCAISPNVCALSALSSLGRLTVTSATPSSCSQSKFSYATGLLRLLRGALDLDRGDLDRRDRARVLAAALGRRLGDLVEHVVARDQAAERGVLLVEEARLAMADEELAAGRIGVRRARHRQDPAHVRRVVELGLDLVARTAGAGALRATALDHEARDRAVEHGAVVEALFGELDEVVDVPRRLVREELERHRARAGLDHGGDAVVLAGLLLAQHVADFLARRALQLPEALSTTACWIVCGSLGLSAPLRGTAAILSTVSMPLTTSPNALYCPSRPVFLPCMMKNLHEAELGSLVRAIESTPRTWCLSLLNSACSLRLPSPPPVPVGSPPWIMKLGITRWNVTPS